MEKEDTERQLQLIKMREGVLTEQVGLNSTRKTSLKLKLLFQLTIFHIPVTLFFTSKDWLDVINLKIVENKFRAVTNYIVSVIFLLLKAMRQGDANLDAISSIKLMYSGNDSHFINSKYLQGNTTLSAGGFNIDLSSMSRHYWNLQMLVLRQAR